ncbi:hypothetical protein [Bacillus sp. 1P06AnD]|uniref:hypothetical protein n=1 Tax=Bacillus sp. 1P06AnD TaxID=3132208 RepID=UPI0039A389EE
MYSYQRVNLDWSRRIKKKEPIETMTQIDATYEIHTDENEVFTGVFKGKHFDDPHEVYFVWIDNSFKKLRRLTKDDVIMCKKI